MAIQFNANSSAKSVDRAMKLYENGNYLESSAMCTTLLKRNAKEPNLWSILSAAQVGMMKYAEARKSAMKGLKFAPKSPDLQCRLGLTYMSEHRFSEAVSEFKKAQSYQPGHTWSLRCLTDALSRQGKFEEAYETLHKEYEEQPYEIGLWFAYLKVCMKTERYDEAMKIAGTLMNDQVTVRRFRAAMLFVIGELHTKVGEYDRAYEICTEANEIAKEQFEAEKHRAGTDRVIAAWTPETIGSLDKPTRKSDPFVFIVGMPRSGTSLVEQIIASHPAAHGCGELDYINHLAGQFSKDGGGWSYLSQIDRLTKNNLDKAAGLYIDMVSKLAPGASRITDKMPINQMHLGLINAILPNAKIVHCVRDPRDTFVSCYFHHFLGKGNAFTYNPTDFASCFTDYWRLMKHWKEVLDIEILDVVYEDVIADQEGQSRRLIDFIGLDWNEKCLDFHKTKRTTKTLSAEQVNKPIYKSSIARWKKHEKHLGPLLAGLPEDSLRDDD